MINEAVLQMSGIILPIIILVGLYLIIFKPYWAFLFATFVPLCFSMQTSTFARIEALGPYFNLYDACLVISLLACLTDRFINKKSFRFPKVALAIITILTIGLLNSMLRLGLTYGVIRSFRWAIGLPLLFIIAANLVDDERRVKLLLVTLIAGTVMAEAQHFFLASSLNVGNLAEKDPEAFRSGTFALANPQVWLLAGPYMIARRIPKLWLQVGIGSLLLAASTLDQSRSVALSIVLALIVCHLYFFKGPHAYRIKRILTLVIIGIISLCFLLILNFTPLLSHTWNKLDRTMTKSSTDETLSSRKLDFMMEGRDFLESNIIFGRGLYYYEIYDKKYHGSVAFGHLGYITYLSQLGIIGFLVYAVFFPGSIIIKARRLFLQPSVSPGSIYLAALAGAFFIEMSLMFFFSASYLSTSIFPGILAGAIWRISFTEW